jgi:hypothetical protein
MPTSIPLTSPTEVTRVGATDQWTGLGDGLPATSTPYQPADKSWYVRLRLVPSAPLPALPLLLDLEVDASYAPTATGTLIVDDVVQLGDSTAPTGSNHALLTAETGSAKTYSVSTAGITLADLNNGDVYLWLAWKSLPETAFDPADWTIDYLYDGDVVTDSGGTVPWALAPQGGVRSGNSAHASGPEVAEASSSGDVTVRATWIGVGTAPAYVPLSIHSKASYTASGSPAGGTADNGQGDAVVAGTSEGTHTHVVAVVAGVASTVISLFATGTGTAATMFDACGASAEIDVDATITDPDDSTLTLTSASLEYELLPSGNDNDFDGPFGLGDDMGYAKIDDVRTISAQFTRPSTQEAYDATGSPAYRVYESTTTTPILTGSLALQDDGNTVGFYSANITVSAANGFEVDKTYTVRVSATVDSVAQGGIVDRFQVRDLAVDIDSDDYGDEPGRGTLTLRKQIAQVWRYLYNGGIVANGRLKVYRDGSTDTMMEGTVTTQVNSTAKGQMDD